MPTLEHHDPRSLTPWLSRYSIDKQRTVWVIAHHEDGRRELIDARHWIETLHNAERWPDGTWFDLVVANDSPDSGST